MPNPTSHSAATAKRTALRAALLETGDPALRRIAEDWHPEAKPASDHGRGYALAMTHVAYALAEAAGVDTTPYLETP